MSIIEVLPILQGYRTGYQYKNPASNTRRPKPKSDVELPGNAHGHTIPLDEIQGLRNFALLNECSVPCGKFVDQFLGSFWLGM